MSINNVTVLLGFLKKKKKTFDCRLLFFSICNFTPLLYLFQIMTNFIYEKQKATN